MDDLLAQLAATGSMIPAVIVTAHGDDEARRRALQAGASAFVGKHSNGDALLDAVRSAMHGRGSRPC